MKPKTGHRYCHLFTNRFKLDTLSNLSSVYGPPTRARSSLRIGLFVFQEDDSVFKDGGVAAVWVGFQASPEFPGHLPMNITLTPENAAIIAWYAKILGCSESEYLNRYLELKLDEPEAPPYDAKEAMYHLAQLPFKSREEAQRVLDWYYVTAKAEALRDGDTIRIRTEIIEMYPGYSDLLKAQGAEAVFMVKTAVCYVNKKDQPIVVTSNDNVGDDDDDKPKYHWSDEGVGNPNP
jgi:hypothetical protein